MVQNNMSKTPSASQEIHMDVLENPTIQPFGKGARRKNRFKGSDGSTSSDTTSNSFVRQERGEIHIDIAATAVDLVQTFHYAFTSDILMWKFCNKFAPCEDPVFPY